LKNAEPANQASLYGPRRDVKTALGLRAARWIALVVSGVAVFVAVLRAARLLWVPIGDEALMWLRTFDVGGAHTPLTGPYSRLGFHHPGPAMYFLFAPVVRLLGGSPNGLLVVPLLVSFGCAMGLVTLVARRAGGVTAVVFAVFTAAMGVAWGDWLMDPWNPFFVVFPFTLFFVGAWLASAGDALGARWACVAGSVAAQSHLGSLLPVVVIGFAAAALAVTSYPRGIRWRNAAWNAGLLAVMWLPPLIDQTTSPEGNFRAIYRYFATPGKKDPIVGWKNGLAMSGGQLFPWSPWIGHDERGFIGDVIPRPLWQLAVVLGLVAVTYALARRFRDRLALRLVALEVAALLGTVVAHAETRGPCFYYLVLWTRPIAMVITAAPLVVVARRFWPGRLPDVNRLWAALGVGVVAVAISARSFRADIPTPLWSQLHAMLCEAALHQVPKESRVRVTTTGPAYTGSPESLAAVFAWAGRSAQLLPNYAFSAGEHRTAPKNFVLGTLIIATGKAAETVAHLPKVRTLFYFDPLTPDERREAYALRAQLEKHLVELGRSDLVNPLGDGDVWITTQLARPFDPVIANRYFELTHGLARMPIALYALPPSTW
jgi:hypothetical protein